LTDEYRDLVDEANDLIKSMRQQGVAELKERPGDGKVIRALLGIMVHDAQSGRDGMVLEVGQALIDAKINPKYFEQAAKIDRLELGQKHVFDELVIRHREAVADDLPRVKLSTSVGDIVIELFENEAPNTVRNFVSLIESGYYSNKLFHRVIDDFMAQGGGFETVGIGRGGPGYQIECECRNADARRNFSGTISMAHAGRDTGGSQFFLNFKHNDFLDGGHTVFGRIVEGGDVLDRLERTAVSVNGMERPIKQAKPDKIVTAEVVRKRDHSYRVRRKGEPEIPEEKEEAASDEEPALELEDKLSDKETEKDSDTETDKSESETSDSDGDKEKEDETGGEAEKDSGEEDDSASETGSTDEPVSEENDDDKS
jgi:cyclophilin family peptidyl-prolyl cis-trans isomerase